jgi:hypothetical protein
VSKFIHVKSNRFRILPGEREELVNDGMYGKALAEYLQTQLRNRGYEVPFICCEDWGWWVELKTAPFTFGVCIYCGPETVRPLDLFCTDGVTSPKKWSWKKLRFIDTSPWVDSLHEELMAIFDADEEVEVVGVSHELPL